MWPIDCPSNAISPSLGSISRQMMRDVVLLPEPDSPTRPTLSPALIVIEKSATAAAPSSNRFASFCTSSSGGVPGAGCGLGATCIAMCRPLSSSGTRSAIRELAVGEAATRRLV